MSNMLRTQIRPTSVVIIDIIDMKVLGWKEKAASFFFELPALVEDAIADTEV